MVIIEQVGAVHEDGIRHAREPRHEAGGNAERQELPADEIPEATMQQQPSEVPGGAGGAGGARRAGGGVRREVAARHLEGQARVDVAAAAGARRHHHHLRCG
jgi:hypothetical protein